MNDERTNLPAMRAGGAVAAIVPQTFEDAWRLAAAISASGMAPYGMQTREQVMVAIMHGAELGLPPMISVQSIAVINGRPSIWGDAALALVKANQLCEYVREEHDGEGDALTYRCRCKRKGDPEETVGTFSVADAKRAGLWDERPRVKKKNKKTGETWEAANDSPWFRYYPRMLQLRARGFALRDAFPDVLKGLAIGEEQRDIATDRAEVQDVTPAREPVDPNVVTIEHRSSDADQTSPGSGRSDDAGGEGAAVSVRDSSPPAPEGPAVSELLDRLDKALAPVTTVEDIEDIYASLDIDATLASTEDGVAAARKIKARHRERIEAQAKPAAQDSEEHAAAIAEQKRQNEEKAARRARKPQEKESAEKAAKPDPEPDPVEAFKSRTLAHVRKMKADGASHEDVGAYFKTLAFERAELGVKPAVTHALRADIIAIMNGEKE